MTTFLIILFIYLNGAIPTYRWYQKVPAHKVPLIKGIAGGCPTDTERKVFGFFSALWWPLTITLKLAGPITCKLLKVVALPGIWLTEQAPKKFLEKKEARKKKRLKEGSIPKAEVVQ